MNVFLDREKFYYSKNGLDLQFSQKDENDQQANHQKAKLQKEEIEKQERIERELYGSIKLKQVANPKEIEEFENITNREFNNAFELNL